MNTTTVLDEVNNSIDQLSASLSTLRQERGYTLEYVASKLHLRVCVIELIENSQFDLLPEPVFVKGYLRAYSKLLDVSPDPFLAAFNNQHVCEKKIERALWQSKRETHKAEHAVRWFTVLFAVGVLVAVGVWWQKNRDNQQAFPTKDVVSDLSFHQTSTELKLTDLSKMHTLLNPEIQMSPMEKTGV